MKARNQQLLRLGVLLLAVVVLPGWDCGGPLLTNPGFDLWCGDTLCAWKVEAGSIRRVPTWHRSDFGVELLGGETVLSQLVHTNVECLVVELQAQRDPGVELSLELDFLGDGSSDHVQPITSKDWVPASFKLAAPTWYQDVRFVVRKRGNGRAVLAHIGATIGSECKSSPLPFLNRPVGAGCRANSECALARCLSLSPFWSELKTPLDKACAECESDAECGAGERCGLAPSPYFWKHRACVLPAKQGLGAPCLADAECGGGICCEGVCSACCAGRACAGGERCARAELASVGMSFSNQALPMQCAPGEPRGAPGSDCIRDADCASQGCLGPRTVGYCVGGFLDFEGRCETSAECGKGYACEPVAILGGVCR